MNDRQDPRMEDKLDEALEETFPASDPPANTVETGIGLELPQNHDAGVTDNRAAQRFELAINGEVAYLSYQRRGDALTLVHTEVPPSLRGRHLGEVLVKEGLESARAQGLRVVPLCPFVKDYLRKHPGS